MENEWAWAAGLFEGEGSIVPLTSRPRLQLKMTDEDVILKLWGIVGGRVYGPYCYQQPDGHVRQPFWTWTSDGADPLTILRKFRPWFCERRTASADIWI